MDAIEALKSRRSIRIYEKRMIGRELLANLVDCARLAPSAINQQTWEFVIITEPARIARLAELIPQASWLIDAPACIAVLVKPVSYYVEDGASATVVLQIAATALGLGACWISGERQPYADAVREALGAPASYRLFSLITVGYPAESPIKDKRPLESIVHWEKF